MRALILTISDILFQHKVPLQPDDSAEMIVKRVLTAEHYYFSQVIEKWVLDQGNKTNSD